MWFLFGEVSSSSGCLGWATLFYAALPEPSYNYFGNLGFSIGKWENSGYFRNYCSQWPDNL